MFGWSDWMMDCTILALSWVNEAAALPALLPPELSDKVRLSIDAATADGGGESGGVIETWSFAGDDCILVDCFAPPPVLAFVTFVCTGSFCSLHFPLNNFLKADFMERRS